MPLLPPAAKSLLLSSHGMNTQQLYTFGAVCPPLRTEAARYCSEAGSAPGLRKDQILRWFAPAMTVTESIAADPRQ